MSHQREISLRQLNSIVKDALRECLPDRYWVRAELSDVRTAGPGHCYLEFIEKDPKTNQIVAKARGNIWAFRWNLLRPMFESQTGQTFSSGIKVLVEVSVEFHEIYGYSLVVNDIDPAYTLGDMARQRAEILRWLEEDGVKDMNKDLEMPAVPSRIAVISSATAAGYGDFMNQILNNDRGYVFYTKLFPAVMQGSQTEESIISALNNIYERQDLFDVVVLIRGGGATSDLNSFDSYLLALNCAQFPLPIITGIGHDRDETVLDHVAHTRVKTPTAAAEYLISRMDEAYAYAIELRNNFTSIVTDMMNREKIRLASVSDIIPHIVRNITGNETLKLQRLSTKINHLSKEKVRSGQIRLEVLAERIRNAVPGRLKQEAGKLDNIEKIVELVSPENILKKGYSYTMVNGHTIRNIEELKVGDEIVTVLSGGSVSSRVDRIDRKSKKINN